MADLNEKFDIWKNKLLDMSLRNKLLNYKDTKRSTLRIKNPNIFSLWESFVINENPLVFPFVDETESSDSVALQEAENSSDTNAVNKVKASQTDENQIVTDKSPRDRQRTLRNLRARSKSFMEEQGINVLYLSFGFLQWSEKDSFDKFHEAPLILVPVKLSWESIMAPFILELHEDEIVLNPTLSYKLEMDFGYKLPDFDMEKPLDDFLCQVENDIKSKNWRIEREVSLGMMSFLKINMYQDLIAHEETILGNPIIQAIGGDPSKITNDLSELDDYDFDHNIKPEDVFQVVDADASQQDAILCAQKGISFVLQGPPGTGKSQTITNIIAESLANGKKILFVSEKMAALDVVYKRLNAAGLSDFCLVLHSYKANKKDILSQLDSVLKLASKKYSISNEIYQELNLLTECRDKLNAYSEEIYTVIEPLHKTIYEVNGILASVNDYENIQFSIPDIRKTSTERYNKFLNTLQQFSEVLESQKYDYHTNPWRDSAVEFVTFELRQGIQVRVPLLIDAIQQLMSVYSEAVNDLFIEVPDTYAGCKQLLQILNLAKECVPFQSSWVFQKDIAPLYNEVSQCENINKRIIMERSKLQHEILTIQEYDSNFDYLDPMLVSDCASLQTFLSDFDSIVEQDSCYTAWQDKKVYDSLPATYSAYQKTIEEYSALRESVSSEYEQEIFQIPYNDIYFRFKLQSGNRFKILNSQYRKDKKLIQNIHKGSQIKLDDGDILEVLSTLRTIAEKKEWLDTHKEEMQNLFPGYCEDEQINFDDIKNHITAFDSIDKVKKQIERLQQCLEESMNHEEALKEHFNHMYAGMDTDWDAIRRSLDWANAFIARLNDQISDNKKFISKLADDQTFAEKCGNYADRLSQALSDTDDDFTWFASLFKDGQSFEDAPLGSITNRFSECDDSLEAFEEWIDYTNIRRDCLDLGLGDYIEALEESDVPPDHIVGIFKKRFFSLWLDSVYSEFPDVANFRRKIQDSTIEDFRRLDKNQFDIATARIRYKLINNLPALNHFTSGVDEVSVLKRELGKQRKIMPIRKLFQRIPDLIMALKPCLMMSPLSVSRFLESDSFQFDIVIFDEASQVNTENAIGAISRGKQVIIAGDSKQLPPTSFFTSYASENEYDLDDDIDEDETIAFESVLDEAMLLPERTLLWHYRSKHEHLIAFSNAKIYHNSLITFPSRVESAPDLGVEYIYVEDGYYDRGGRNGNIIEAKKVAETVFEHFRAHPERSLGVITFGDVQQQAIDTVLREMRQEDPSYEYFFEEDKEEPFFVKSLENVQGDERDTIIFSIGYGKDAYGIMRMNFGPLSKAGGERRLNVAITRAKYNVKLVGSILATDIDIDRVSQEGPKLLRAYIEFANKGPKSLMEETTESDIIQLESPFEEVVFNFLDRKGYQVVTQVGCSGYRIDMAIKHPTLSGQYVLGIECDGATYHSARIARERDRLRQDVLESMGWKVYRIWSTDWVKNPQAEQERLIKAIEDAFSGYNNESESIKNETPSEVEVIQDEGTSEYDEHEKFLMEDYGSTPNADIPNPYNFKPYPTNFSYAKRKKIYAPFIETVSHIIRKMYPIHFDEICRLAAPSTGRENVTSVVKKRVNSALTDLKDKFDVKEGFYFPKNSGGSIDLYNIPYRFADGRSVKNISTLELASGMLAVANACVGATKESLIIETIRAFGFKRSGENIVAAFNKAYNYLINHQYIKKENGKIVVIN